MADFNALQAIINAYIKRNGVQAITGQILNGVLTGMVNALGKGYTVAGAASPTTDPGTMTGPLAYIAYTAGTYTHFDNLEVEQGEVSMLIYNEAEWHKEVLFSLAAQATVDDNIGVPSVGVSFVDGILTFNFRNMKGEPGENGQDGDPAGFGTISASISGGVGTPGVSVQSSGPDTAKNIAFQFTNLKGETGVTSCVVTVDNTTGNPSCAVSLVGQELHLDFSGLKGAQGNTGSSVDYPFTIVNNLTTDDATQALSAAMGVQLESEVSQLEAEVDGKMSEFSPVWNTGKYINTSGTLSNSGSWAYSDPILLKAGKTITVNTQGSGFTAIALTDENATSYTPLVKSPSGMSGNNPYSYTAAEDMYVALSGRVGDHDVTVYEGIKTDDSLVKRVSVLDYNVGGKTSSSWTASTSGSHSSDNDRIRVNIKNGETFLLRLDGAGGTAYFYNASNTQIGTQWCALGVSNTVVAPGDIYEIGVYHGSQPAVVTVTLSAWTGMAYAIEKNGVDINALAPMKDREKLRSSVLFYTTPDFYVEKTATNLFIKASSFYIRCAGSYVHDLTLTTSALATALGLSTATSDAGVAGCIPIASDYVLVYDLDDFALKYKARGNVDGSDIVLLSWNAGAKSVLLSGFLRDRYTAQLETELSDSVKNNTIISPYNTEDVETKCKEYTAKFVDTDNAESFLFFTDPHLMGYNNTWTENQRLVFNRYLSLVAKYYNSLPCYAFISGGDWLNSGDDKETACWKLGIVNGALRHLFRNYLPVLGNHDLNYQGEDGVDSTLPNGTLRNLLFADEGANYYTKKYGMTQYWVLDSGSDAEQTMSTYRWEQIDWLGENILAKDEKHNIIVVHMYYYSEQYTSALASNLTKLLNAYNTRTTITLNGKTYNFATATGIVHFVLVGHSHADFDLVADGIPVIASINVNADFNHTPSFDLALADYDNQKLYLIRVGQGQNREIDIL